VGAKKPRALRREERSIWALKRLREDGEVSVADLQDPKREPEVVGDAAAKSALRQAAEAVGTCHLGWTVVEFEDSENGLTLQAMNTRGRYSAAAIESHYRIAKHLIARKLLTDTTTFVDGGRTTLIAVLEIVRKVGFSGSICTNSFLLAHSLCQMSYMKDHREYKTIPTNVFLVGGRLSFSDEATYYRGDTQDLPDGIPDGIPQALMGVNAIDPVSGKISSARGDKFKREILSRCSDRIFVLAGKTKIVPDLVDGNLVLNPTEKADAKIIKRTTIVTNVALPKKDRESLEKHGYTVEHP
jgi:hypothetical protein